MRNRPSEKEISSTEKLLNVIRGRGGKAGEQHAAEQADAKAAPEQVSGTRSRRFFSPNSISLKKHITVGVDIGHTYLRLAKIQQVSEQRFRLLAYKTVLYKPDVSVGNQKFLDLLKGAVTELAGSSNKVQFWAIMSAADVDVRHLRVPKVPRRQLYNAVFWTAKKEMSFDEKENVFDFEVQGDVQEKGVTKTAVMVTITPAQQIKAVKDLFVKSGIPLTGITIAPFAIQNLFRSNWLQAGEHASASLYMGNNFSRIDIYNRGNLALTRGIKTGMSSMIEALMDGYAEGPSEVSLQIADDGDFSIPMVMEEQRTMTQDDARRALLNTGSEDKGGEPDHPSFSLTDRQLLDLVGPALQRLVRQIERTFQHYLTLPGSDTVGKIFISGVVLTSEGIVNYIGDQLGIEKEPLDPLAPGLLSSSDVLPPAALSDRVQYTAAIGLALSGNSRTPNAIFSFQDKERQERILRINRGIMIGFLAVMGCLLGYFFWQSHLSSRKEALVTQLQNQLAGYSVPIDEAGIQQMAARVKQRDQLLKQKSRLFLMPAAIADLSGITPPNIKLLSMNIDFGPVPAKQAKPGTEVMSKPGQEAKAASSSRSLVVEGIVTGEQQLLESLLASYVMRIEASPIFFNPSIHNSTFEMRQVEGEVLHFTLKIGILQP